MSKMFRIGKKFINLEMLTQVQVLPGSEWEDEKFDAHWPSLYVQLIGNSDVSIRRSDLADCGFDSVDAIAAAVIAAVDAL